MRTVQLIVGGAVAPVDREASTDSPVRARTCRDLAVLLERISAVDSVVTTGFLPDGDYVDVVRLLASRAQPSEVIVVNHDGNPILRFEIEGGMSKFERLWDVEFSLRSGGRPLGQRRIGPQAAGSAKVASHRSARAKGAGG